MRASPGDRVLYDYDEKTWLGLIQNIDNQDTAAVSLYGRGNIIYTNNDFETVLGTDKNLVIVIDSSSTITMDVQNRDLIITTT